MTEILGQRSEMNRKSGHLLLALGIAVSGAAVAPAVRAEAAVISCKGPECIGKDPAGMCDGDAVTVKTKTVYFPGTFTAAGQLDLRYSRYCEANWGRFSAFQKKNLWRSAVLDPFGQGVRQAVPDGRVTAWNINEPSQSAAKGHAKESIQGITWTKMVDGRHVACTGVELTTFDPNGGPSDTESYGWQDGPCY